MLLCVFSQQRNYERKSSQKKANWNRKTALHLFHPHPSSDTTAETLSPKILTQLRLQRWTCKPWSATNNNSPLQNVFKVQQGCLFFCLRDHPPDCFITRMLVCPPWLPLANGLLYVRNKAGPIQRATLIKLGWAVAKVSREHRVYDIHRDYCKGHHSLQQQVGILMLKMKIRHRANTFEYIRKVNYVFYFTRHL